MTDNFPYPPLFSNCCNAELINPEDAEYYAGNETFEITGRCPACKDGCQFLTQEEMEREDDYKN